MPQTLELSVVVPVFNEAGCIEALVGEIAAALDGRAYEMIVVDDASTDDTYTRLVGLKSTFPALRVARHQQNAGQSRAIRTGVSLARGRIVGTLDGDGQNDPADLPDLYRQLLRADAPEHLGMVMGERVIRRDGAWKAFGSRFGNRLRRWVLKDQNRDSACGIKVLPREVFLSLPYFDHMHRYMPALVQAEGHSVEARDVNHRPRKSGRTKYSNFGRLLDGWSDLRAVAWLMRRRRHPGTVSEA